MSYTPLEQNAADLAAILCAHRDAAGLPWIGDDGSWKIGDIDTGIPAAPGSTPSVDENGNWRIDDVSTGIPAGDIPSGAKIPSIGDNGNWKVGDTDTGIEAKPGDKPSVSDEGRVKINDTDTGIDFITGQVDETCTVTYASAHGTPPAAKTVTKGYALTAADLPVLTAQDYTHDGWLLDGKPVKAGKTVTESITLTARWRDADYTMGYAAGYAQAQLDGVKSGAHPNAQGVYLPAYRALYVSVTSDADGETYQVQEKGQRWDDLGLDASASYTAGYRDGYTYGYPYAAQWNGQYIGALTYSWDADGATLAVNEEYGYVSELPENTYGEE